MHHATERAASQRRILRRDEAAAYLGLSAATLATAALRGDPEFPPIIRLTKRAIGYDIRDLDEWIERNRAG